MKGLFQLLKNSPTSKLSPKLYLCFSNFFNKVYCNLVYV